MDSNPSPLSRGFSKKEWLCLLLIVSAVFLSFLPILHNEFMNWDDNQFITENTEIRDLNWSNLKKIFTRTYVKVYVPLTLISWGLEYKLVGYEPFLYYLNNLLLHCFVSALVFVFARRLGLSVAAAFLGALLFGVHPVHVESVAWATERKDVLFASFFMLALLQYISYLNDKRKISYVLTLLFGLLSILAKPTALGLPFALGALDIYHRRKFDKFFILDKIPFFLYIIPIASMTFLRQSGGEPVNFPGGTLNEAIPIFFFSAAFYIQKFVWPLHLIPYYQLPQPLSMANASYMVSAGVVVVCFVLLACLRRNRLYVFANLFFIGTIFCIIRYGDFIQYTSVVADRFIYISSVGFCVFAGQFFYDILKAIGQKKVLLKRVFMVLLAVLYVLLAAKTFTQSKIWKDAVTYWSHTIKVNPQYNVKAYLLRAHAYVLKDELELALSDCNSAIQINATEGAVYAQRGVIFSKLGYADLALSDLNMALKLKYTKSLVFVNRAEVYIEKGELDLAIADANQALELGNSDAKAYALLGKAYGLKGDYQRAVDNLESAILLNKADPVAYYDRGYFYSRLGETDKAIADYSHALAIDPEDIFTLDARGGLYFQSQEYGLALNDFNKVITLNTGYARGYNNRGSVYLAQGKLQAALDDFNKAIALDPAYALAYLNRSVVYQQQGKRQEAHLDALKAKELGQAVEEEYINELSQ